jgi:pimeloyl-ACP methyl ester carboxylesterase
MRPLVTLVGVIGGFYALLLLFLYFYQSNLVFFPDARLYSTPERVGLVFDDVHLQSGSARVHGWFVPGDSAAPVVLFAHGNAGNMADRVGMLQEIREAGLTVLIFDYAGYGESTGSPSEEQTYSDVRAAFDWLLARGYAPGQVILFGRSLGGAVVSWLARKNPVMGLVLAEPFTSLVDVGKVHYPWVPVSLILKSRYPTDEFIRDVIAPVVIIASPQDEIVPYVQGEKLHELAPAPKRFITTAGSHNMLAPLNWAELRQWLEMLPE